MTYKDYYLLIGEALNTSDLDTFVAEWATSVIFDPDPDAPGPDFNAVIADLTNIYTVAHMGVKEMAEAAGLRQVDLSRRFAIPLRTVQGWVHGERECPHYVRLMMADLLGLVTVDRV